MAKPNLKVVEDVFAVEVAGCLGNSKRNYASVSADLLNQAFRSGTKLKTLAAMCELHTTTIDRMMKDGGSDTYKPNSLTNENVHRAFGMTPTFHFELLKPRYRPKPKNPE